MQKLIKNLIISSLLAINLIAAFAVFSPVGAKSPLSAPVSAAAGCRNYVVVWSQLAARAAPDRSSTVIFTKDHGQWVKDYGYGSMFGDDGRLYRYMTDPYSGKVGWMIVDGVSYVGQC